MATDHRYSMAIETLISILTLLVSAYTEDKLEMMVKDPKLVFDIIKVGL